MDSRLLLALLFFCLLLALLFLHGFLGPIPGCFYLSVTSVRSGFFCSLHPSPAAIGLLLRAPSTRYTLLLLPLSWLTDSLSPFLPSSGYFSVLPARVADFFFFCADAWFLLVRVPALVGFFWPDCDFLVVIVPVTSLSRSFVRHFLSVQLLQLHLVVVYSDEAVGGHSSTAV